MFAYGFRSVSLRRYRSWECICTFARLARRDRRLLFRGSNRYVKPSVHLEIICIPGSSFFGKVTSNVDVSISRVILEKRQDVSRKRRNCIDTTRVNIPDALSIHRMVDITRSRPFKRLGEPPPTWRILIASCVQISSRYRNCYSYCERRTITLNIILLKFEYGEKVTRRAPLLYKISITCKIY